MKMIVNVSLIILILVLSALQAAASQDYKDVADALIIKLRLPEKTVAYVKTADAPQFKGYKAVIYEVSHGAITMPLAVYVSKNKKIAIFGEVFVNGNSLMALSGLEAKQKKLSFPLTEKDHIIYSPQGKKTVFMFFDPECPYCVEALEKIKAYEGDEYKFVLKYFPLEGIHPGARQESLAMQQGWLRKTSGLAESDIEKRAQEIVDRDTSEAKRAGINGTPYFVMDGVFLESSPLDAAGNMN
jgi:protein-disulfide isomerase